MKKIFFTLFFSFTFLYGNSQNCYAKRNKKEFIDKERIAYFTTYLNLTPKEAEKFWPVYNQYLNEKEKIYRQIRNIKQKLKNSSNQEGTEAIKLNQKYIDLLKKEYLLIKIYNEKFKKILPIFKVNKLYFAERDFRRYLIKKIRRR